MEIVMQVWCLISMAVEHIKHAKMREAWVYLDITAQPVYYIHFIPTVAYTSLPLHYVLFYSIL